jgi:Kef-type K+ transport system membrane component KefB
MLLLGKIALFFVITGIIGLFLFPWGGRLMHHLRAKELEISAILVGAFAFAVLAHMLALHFIVGAFVAGLFFGRKTINAASYERVKNTISAMTFGFLAPIFFASIGLNLDFDALTGAPLVAVLLIVAAFFGKIVGAGGAARGIGFSARESMAIGVGMSPRGAVELVIAGIALKAGLFDTVGVAEPVVENLFSAVVVMAVVTTVLSPIILKRVFSNPDG